MKELTKSNEILSQKIGKCKRVISSVYEYLRRLIAAINVTDKEAILHELEVSLSSISKKSEFDFKAFDDLILLLQREQENKEKLEIINDELTHRLLSYDSFKVQGAADKEVARMLAEDYEGQLLRLEEKLRVQ